MATMQTTTGFGAETFTSSRASISKRFAASSRWGTRRNHLETVIESNLGALQHLELAPGEPDEIDAFATESDIDLWADSSHAD